MQGDKENNAGKELIIVSGLPRSGTSMMMKMLAGGGLEAVVDHQRVPDEDNPLGYFEDERVKDLSKDNTWITAELGGKVIKVISMLLYHLPPELSYKVIFLNRRVEEVLASQQKMLARRGITETGPDDAVMAAKWEEHITKVAEWLKQQDNFEVLYVDYAETVASPREHAGMVRDFLGMNLDVDAMAEAVNPSMYRNRIK